MPEGARIHIQVPALGGRIQVQGRAGLHAPAGHRLPGRKDRCGDPRGEPRAGAAQRDRRQEGHPQQRGPDAPAGHTHRRQRLCREGRRDHSEDNGRGDVAPPRRSGRPRISEAVPRLRHAAAPQRGRGQVVLPQLRRMPHADKGQADALRIAQGHGHTRRRGHDRPVLRGVARRPPVRPVQDKRLPAAGTAGLAGALGAEIPRQPGAVARGAFREGAVRARHQVCRRDDSAHSRAALRQHRRPRRRRQGTAARSGRRGAASPTDSKATP